MNYKTPLTAIHYEPPQPGSVWKHYKGELYVVEFMVLNADNDSMKEMVVYRRLAPFGNTPIRYCRSLNDWSAIVRDGVRRFEPDR